MSKNLAEMPDQTVVPPPRQPLTWILTDGTIGMRIQCLGLAKAAGLSPIVKCIHPNWLLRALPGLGAVGGIPASTGGDPLTVPWPDVVISCGRRTAGAALAVKRMSRGRAFLAHIQDPRMDPRRFDLLVVPEHDPTRGANVVTTLGALNPHDPETLARAARTRELEVAGLPRPLVAVMVGGSNKRYEFSPVAVGCFIAQLGEVADAGAGLLVATSRRTDAATRAAIGAGLAGRPAIVWTGDGENPYLAFLGLADAIIVTSDSVNMASEACATGKPVHIATVEPESGRLADFHRRLHAAGHSRPFAGRIESWSHPPLDETPRVGEILRRRLAERGVVADG